MLFSTKPSRDFSWYVSIRSLFTALEKGEKKQMLVLTAKKMSDHDFTVIKKKKKDSLFLKIWCQCFDYGANVFLCYYLYSSANYLQHIITVHICINLGLQLKVYKQCLNRPSSQNRTQMYFHMYLIFLNFFYYCIFFLVPIKRKHINAYYSGQ